MLRKINIGINKGIFLFAIVILLLSLFFMKQTSDYKRITVVDAHSLDLSYFKENAISILKIKNIAQIVAKIESESEIQILDIFAHGEAGKIIIGQDQITLNNIDQYKNTLTILGRHLADDAHINLLGCDIAQTEAGKLLVDKFSQYTGVSVAASDDKTGSATLGGDWELEYVTQPLLFNNKYTIKTYANYSNILANINGTINNYAAVNSINGNDVSVDSAVGFSLGDTVLIIQMTGASADLNGKITSWNNIGNFEFATITNLAGTTVSVNAITKTYTTTEKVQLIKVSDTSADATTTTTGVITGDGWDGDKGGVVVIKAQHLILNHNIDMSGVNTGAVSDRYAGKGFWGGDARMMQNGFSVVDIPEQGASPRGTGGGGATGDNNSGGGGANFGTGACGAGYYGGPFVSGQSGTGGWGLDGLGLAPGSFPLMMGGGGGSGHNNNTHWGQGGNGGGVIIIVADEITGGGGQILANGANGWNDMTDFGWHDGSGGGGGGGAVYFDIPTVSGALTVQVKGGNGGPISGNHAGGGGGGGGALFIDNATLLAGVTLQANGGGNGGGGGYWGGDGGVGRAGGLVNLNGIPTVGVGTGSTCYAGVSYTFDYGDLPDNYKTLSASNGARHANPGSSLYIGVSSTVDTETDGFPSSNADGDDISTGTNDENAFITNPAPFISKTAATYTVNVPVTNNNWTSAWLYAWLDWNQNNAFDANEFASIEVPINHPGTPLPLTFTGLTGLVDGTAALRLRLTPYSKFDANDYVGAVIGGEIEDHMIPIGDVDFGDAPDTNSSTSANNYKTLYSHGGPYHYVNTDLYIGSAAADADVGDLQDSTATADDLDDPDESNLNLPPIQVSSDDYKIYLPTTNNTGSTATLVGWVDFNRNGQFEDSEGQLVQIPSGVTQVNTELEWNNINPSSSTHLFMRLRLIDRVITDITNVSSLGPDGSGEVEDHLIVMNDIDLGDAPLSYGIDPSLGGAYHFINNATTLYLGTSNIDNDTSDNASNDASEDDNSGNDDENGLAAALMPMPLGSTTYSVTLTIRNTTGNDAYLAGWIDANRNGVFDAIEGQVVTIATGQNGAYTYTFNSDQLSYLNAGNSVVRFRLSTDLLTVTDMNGMASDGEVEDHPILLGGGDFGDLPDTSAATAANNYQTDLANNGPYHRVGGLSGLYLGSQSPDPDTTSLQSTDADGDNLNGVNDEDGLLTQALPVITSGVGYQANVSVTNNSMQDAYLYAWIDWDRDGSFEPDELIQQAVTQPYGVQLITANSGIQTYPLSWLNDVSTVNNTTYGVRLRVTTDLLVDDTNTTTIDERSLGFATNGEVEDFFLTANNLDLGDAPDSYQTLILSDGPAHAYVSNLYLGTATIDNDLIVTPSLASDSDDNTSTDDETGIDQPLPLLPASATSFSIELSAYNASGSMATLVAWLDKNQDGTFSADEVVDDLNVAANGTPFTNATFSSDNYPTSSDNRTNKVTLTWNGLSGLTQGSMGLRIRIANTSLTANDWGGFADGGEVEDYTVSIGEFDFGDAEDGASGTASGAGDYRSTLSDNGPYHGIDNNLFMGAAAPDSEDNAHSSSAATMADGDDTNVVDDEDGVTLGAIDNSPAPTSYTVIVKVTNNTGNDAMLYGWIDFDRNGRFDADEMVSTIVSSSTSGNDIPLTWSNFPGITTGYTLSRFRLTTDTLTHSGAATAEDDRALGGATNGEVEDHRIYIGDHDFGDAPNSYQTTTASQGAAHGLSNKSTLYIGSSNIDAEVDGYASTSATGDNTNDSNDENGIALPLPIISSSGSSFNVTIPVRNSTTTSISSTLIAWLDTNQDGTFSADEVVDLVDYDSTGDQPWVPNNIIYDTSDKNVKLTWNGLSGLTNGSMALRIRLSHDALSANDWYGTASDGEVEDYLYLVGDTDYGDAPDNDIGISVDNYRTTLSDDGARHITSTDLFIGTNATDGETDAVSPSTFALGDDNNVTDDEDGVLYGALSTTQTDYSATTKVTNNSAEPAYLYAWIDFDRNGRFDHDEFIDTGVITLPAASGTTSETLSWSSMNGRVVDTNTYMRVRITHELLTDSASGETEDPRSYGATASGEVEDHWLQVTNSADKGDLEDTYLTSMAVGGPWHTLDGGQIFIGAQAPDSDTTDQLSSVVTGDDNDGNDDEDANIANGEQGDTDYNTTIAVTNTTGVNVYLNAWVDWNLNGSFEASEHFTATVAPTDISKTLSWTGLNALEPGYYPIRMRLGDIALTNTGFTGYGGDGEVEDHRLLIQAMVLGNPVTATDDYGDAPSSYGTYESDNGAKHGLSANLYIGSIIPDGDINGQPSANADADDLNLPDDEDTLTIPVLSPSMTTWSLDVPVTNTTGSNATLYAWVDHDLDGEFQADEMTSVAVPDSTTTATLNWINLSGGNGGNVGDSVIRLRLTTDDLDSTQPDNAGTADVDERALGAASDGEIEDHHHKVTFHLLITQGISGTDHKIGVSGSPGNDIYTIFEAKFGVGYVSHDEVAPIQDLTTEFTLTDYQTILFKHFKDAAGTPEYDTSAEMDALIAYRNQGGILQVTTEGGRLADNYEYIHSYIVNRMGYPGATTNAYNAYSGPSNMTRLHTPTASAGGLAVQNTIQTSGSTASLKGIDHRSILYATTTVPDSCSNINAVVWMIPYNPTSTGGYTFPKSQVGPYLATSERVHYFTWYYGTGNSVNYQEFANFAYDYYEDAAAFNARNNWLDDANNLNPTCPTTALDFGDAPDTNASQGGNNYSTAYQFDGPRHANNGEVYIGTAPSLEADAYANINADGDVDDGVTLTPAFSGENTYTVIVNATNDKSTDANLVAWFDYNRNGQFEASEGVTQVVPANTSAQDYSLTFNLAGTIANNTTYYARFRITTDAIDTSNELGAASDGEVEDYKIIGIQGGIFDGGDAPDSYMTSFSSGGPYHVKTNDLLMGQPNNLVSPDTESPVPSVGANSDDNNSVNNDEDGLQLPSLLVEHNEYTLQVIGHNAIGSGLTAKIVVWIDWDRSGTFDQNEGQTYDGIPSDSTYIYANFTWTGLSLTPGDYYVRARIMPSTDAIDETTPGGYASLGEVEDHMITVDSPAVESTVPATFTGCESDTFFEHDFRNFNNTGWSISGLAPGDPFPNASFGFYLVSNSSWDVRLSRPIASRAGETIKVNIMVGQYSAQAGDYFEVFLGGISLGRVESVNMPSTSHAMPQNISVSGIAPSDNARLELLMHHEATGNNDYNVRELTVERIGSSSCTYDYGDAPNTYLTLDASDGARHVITNANGDVSSNMLLGTERDAESNGIPNVAADGDDTNGTPDDEDMVLPTSIVALTSTDIDYVVTGSDGYLNVWVDADIDNTFNTASEHIIQDHPVTVGSNVISTLVPYLGITGSTYIRIRVCELAADCNTASGFAEGGEVEDHVIVLNAPSLDFGDAPDTGTGIGSGNYRTTFNVDLADSGPYQVPDVDLYLGVESADAEADANANISASGDDSNGSNDDEDGIAISPLLISDISYNVIGKVTNNTGNSAYLYVWIDWNNNGRFDKNELVDNGVINIADNTNKQPQSLTWSTLPALSNGNIYYLRARITSNLLDDTATANDEDPRSYGAAANGEVEDHRIVVGDVDFGDALDLYKTTLASNGAYHIVTPTLYLGDQVADSEVDATPDILARNDDANATPDDEDGINILLPVALGDDEYSVIIEANNSTGVEANLWAWVDFNQNNQFDASEAQYKAVPTGTNQGQFTLTWTGLSGVTLAPHRMSYIRVRLTTDTLTATDWQGGASDGEVEDYLLAIGLGDLGDAPESYGTDRIDAAGEGVGPLHIVELIPVVYLGAVAPDEEANGFSDGIDRNRDATDDDDDNINNDEDGVSNLSSAIIAQPSLQVQLTTRVHTDANANLYGWLDFDRDGVFDPITEAAEPVTLSATDDDTDKLLTFTVPSDVLAGISYLRVRICRDTTDCSTPHGLANDGEVEDHQVTLEVQYDYGDAPENSDYKTLTASGGPRHALGLPIYLGSEAPDADTDGFGDGTDSNGDATDDDVKGNSPSDEDGLSAPILYVPEIELADYSATVVCNDHDGASDLGATVYAWLDTNFDGDVDDANEFVSAPCNDADNLTDGSATLTFVGSQTLDYGTTYLRLRITTDTLTQADMNVSASNGEIEDHEWRRDIPRCNALTIPDFPSDLMTLPTTTAENVNWVTIPGDPLNIQHLSGGGNGITKDGVWQSLQYDQGSSHYTRCDGTHPYMMLHDGTVDSDIQCKTGSGGAGYKDFRLRATSGSGTTADPYVVWGSRYWDRNNNNEFDNDDIQVITKVTYVDGDDFFDQTYYLESASGQNIDSIYLAQGFDTLMDGGDRGGAFTVPFQEGSYVPVGASANTVNQTITNQEYRILGVTKQYVPDAQFMGYQAIGNPFDYYYSSYYSIAYNQLTTGDFLFAPQNISTDLNVDNGIGVQWDMGVINECTSNSVRLLFSTVGGAILIEPHDMGDAPDADTSVTQTGDYATQIGSSGPGHKKYDFDGDDVADLMLGTIWDADDGAAQNSLATADDNDDVISDEDGVVFSANIEPNSSETLSITTTVDPDSDLSAVQLYAWIDWNRDGDWEDTGELVVNEPTVATGSNDYTVSVPSDASLGYTYMRVRTCFDTGVCNTSTGVTTSGEVEDYRIFVSDLNLDNTCDSFLVTKSSNNGASFEYTQVEPLNSAFTFNDIKTGITDFPVLNSLAFDRITGMVYSTYINSDNNLAIVVTDKQGTSFIPLGEITSDGSYNISNIDGSGTQSYSVDDVFTNAIGSANTGTLSTNGEEYYITNTLWNSVVIVNLADLTFSIKPLPTELFTGTEQRIGPDWAVSYHDGLLYGADLTGDKNAGIPKLYKYDISSDTLISSDLDFGGRKAPNYFSGAVATDDSTHLYLLTNGGDHDTNGDGSHDLFNRIAMYRINLVSDFTTFVDSGSEAFLQFNDATGCLLSIDYGDAPIDLGSAGHENSDPSMSGTPDLILGSQWDPDLSDRYSADATGDDLSGLDDEDGVAMPIPADLIVATATSLPITVTGMSGYLSVFADLDGDLSFSTSAAETVLNDYPITPGTTNVSILLDAAASGGYNGDSFIRFRLCETQNSCNTPTGTVDNGEVEDYMFNLINQIVLNGTVFEDNGKSGGIAHDGLQDGSERGLANFVVKAIYKGTGISGYVTDQLITSTVTNGAGKYTLVIPVELSDEEIELQVVSQAAWVDISEIDTTEVSLGLHDKVTNVLNTDSKMLIEASAGDFLENLDFGKVSVPTLEPDNYTETEPGLPVVFSHKFNVNTSGDVSFTLTNQQASPSGYPWSEVLYFDANCNGEIDAGVDGFVTNPTAVSADATTQVCVLVKVMVPDNVPLHAVYNYQLNADMAFANTTETRQVSDVDTIKVSFSGAGELELEKTVKNITSGEVDESRSNQAKPGDVLEYKIYFMNNGSGPIDTIKLFDAIPEYTELTEVLNCTSPATLLPSSIVSCNVQAVDDTNAVGYEGGIEWQLGGTLAPAENGYVTYRVKVK
ncbi:MULTISPECIES: GEVED domain-containing protein [unclassified Photobacterium]|uniref:GEVED domain-containing protein n=1 Tax=unclassified Photobacterium TaxID=2628852 RepID=UPI001EDC93F7|nr:MULTISPECIES: GEVED domain-containing protein [unclassified Photobacterium]MCG3865781.1 DUF4347 domain-containing protein [Photobacterium sp. Ph6]MCG3877256.1 DUF4347 domain-containing protein [Photobacterium sp. Ph5]